MFTWWISWLWAWLLWWSWASSAVVDGAWAARMVQEEAIAAVPAAAAAAAAGGSSSAAPSKESSDGKNKDVEFGGGMGGSAIENPGLEGHQYFATQPSTQTAVVGSTVVMPCRVINKVGHLQWTKDGFGLGTERDLYGFSRYAMIGSDDEGDFSLRIQPVLLSDDGMFQCQVSAGEGIPGIRSPAARLTVYMPPDPPVVEPSEVTTTAGMTIHINCTSSGGRPAPEIQWVDDSTRETIRTGAVQYTEKYPDRKRVTVTSHLTFTPRRSHHNSTLTCLTSNQALTSPLAGKVHLQVLFPPEVKLQSRPKTLMEGDEVSFSCSAHANPNKLTYRWFRNTHQLRNESSRSLTLRNVSRTFHQDTISCEVSNSVGTSKKSISIQVMYGPLFRSPPADVAAETGKKARLECDVDSNPPPVISWYQQGNPQVIAKGREYEVIVAPSTAGVYICVASVRGFSELQGRVRVLVKGPPQIVSSGEQQGRMGDTVSLECTTVSIPTPLRITWTYRGREIDLGDPRYEVQEERQDDALRNLLVIHDAETQDFGPYNCSVVNEYGVARKLIFLHREKTVPVLFLVCGFLALIVVAVIVASLVLCNKRHTSGKGSPLPEKSPGGTLVSGPPVVNMYEAPSDTNLSNDLSLTPTHRMYHQLTPTPDENVRAAHTLNTLVTDSPHKSIPEPESNGGTALTFLEFTGGREYTALPNGRRASVNDLGPSAIIPTTGSPNTTSTEFCTIRRGTRAIDVGAKNGRPLMNNYADIPIVPPILPHNGTAHPPNPRHSTYSLTSKGNFGSPPPPPYSRGTKIGSPRGSSSPTGSATPTIASSGVHTDDGASPEAKYIFSPEAMMKPGTLV
ncbi:irregular chiasm C-roughest protein-like [Macrobrachium rosenbergii]|uniref:irregular chiasm C-roughest protein-like n=1 Tax=Macrobrachium rosenbergii TaxID=79674 RepID=UPI0034D7A881